MLSTRPLYGGEVEYFRRTDQGMSMPVGSGASLSDQYDLTSQLNQQSSPPSELEQRSAVSQRKRVPVACDRCRKRKIKCSGDEGNGRGCINCRNAGWEGCQFLRVQSFQTPVASAVVGSSRSWQGSNRFHPYSLPSQRTAGHILSPQPQVSSNPLPYQACPSGLDFPGYSSITHPTAWPRHSYASNYSVPYEVENLSPYTTQPPSYMLPDPDQGSALNVNYSNVLNRHPQSGGWLEQMSSIPYSQQNTQNISSTVYGLSTGNPSSTYQSYGQGQNLITERMLPHPPTSFRSYRMSSRPADDTPDPGSAISATSQRSSIGWQNEAASIASISSTNTTSSVRPESVASYIDPMCPEQEQSYGYIDISNTSQKSIAAYALPVAIDESRGQLTSLSSQSMSVECARVYSDPRESPHSPVPGAATTYGYSIGSSGRRMAARSPRPLTTNSAYSWSSTRNSPNEARLNTEQEKSESQPTSQQLSTSLINTQSY